MTSVNRVGDRTSGHTEETIRIGLTEAAAETLGIIVRRIGGGSGYGDSGSRRVHMDELLEGLAQAGVMAPVLHASPARGDIYFEMDDQYMYPLNAASEEVTYL